ncbi:MAG TPA: efflux RND transporter periplasmic adaptor subunit [Stellaceae bacterium]|nr:efflux RND transporter periplasmic adaptor subunit [Stellaceae bacterium]
MLHEETPDPVPPASPPASGERAPTRRRGWVGAVLGAVVLAAVGIGIYGGIRNRADAEVALAHATNEAAVPTVEVIHPKGSSPDQKLVLPGNTQAFSDTAIYARTNGYLKHWYFDIGAHVKRGQLLADIDTPEIDDQLRQARADLATAEATMKLAAITAERNETLLKTRSVATQDRDNAVGSLNAAKATVQSRQAAVAQLEKLQSFEKIDAPFDGIVTARAIDVGALVASGSGAQTHELFHMVAIDPLRVYVAVPEPYAPAMRAGTAETVTFDEYPDQSFTGTLVRTSNAIDPASRTLLVEIDVPNQSGQLLPGAYALVHFVLPKAAQSVTIPANALLFRKEGLQVGVVHDDQVDLVPIKIGRDFGDAVEVISGLEASDQIVLNPADALVGGTKVIVKTQPTK